MPPVVQPPRRDRLRKLGVFLGTLIILVSLPTIVWQQWHYDKVQHGYHVQTVKILNEHTNTLNEVHQLRVEVTNLIKLYGPDLTAGQRQIIAEYTWIACSLQSGPTHCGPVPKP